MTQNVPAWLLAFVCGLLDAACFVGLGGTFVGLMTGNLILMGVSIADTGMNLANLSFLLPLLGYTLGALSAGQMNASLQRTHLTHDALWIGWFLLLITSALVWVSHPVANTAVGWFVVTATSLYMGFQSACLYLFKSTPLTTNVMTSNMTTFLADIPKQLKARRIFGEKGVAIVLFLLGVITGALFVTYHSIALAYTTSLIIVAVAIYLQIRLTKSAVE